MLPCYIVVDPNVETSESVTGMKHADDPTILGFRMPTVGGIEVAAVATFLSFLSLVAVFRKCSKSKAEHSLSSTEESADPSLSSLAKKANRPTSISTQRVDHLPTITETV